MVAEVILPPTEELGKYFSYAVAEQKVVADMRLGEVVIVPLLAPPEGGLTNFHFPGHHSFDVRQSDWDIRS